MKKTDKICVRVSVIITAVLVVIACFWTPVRAEGLYLTLGAGENFNFSENSVWEDGGGVGAFIAVNYQWDKQWWCFNCMPSVGLTHLSHWDVGCPQDCDECEDEVNHFGVAATWKVWR